MNVANFHLQWTALGSNLRLKRCCCDVSLKWAAKLPLKQGSRKEVFQPLVPEVVFRSHIGSPFTIRTHRSSTHHDLPIFDAPPRMHNPCGSSVSTQNFVGGSFMSIKVSPSITVSFVFSSAILKSPCKKVRAKAAAAEPMLSLSYLSNGWKQKNHIKCCERKNTFLKFL